MSTITVKNRDSLGGQVLSVGFGRLRRKIFVPKAWWRGLAHSLPKGILPLSLLLSHALPGQRVPGARAENRAAPAWSVTMTGGFANTFQLILGGKFGKGGDVQDKLTASINNKFLTGDSLSIFGWSTTDLSSGTPNRQFGLLYKLPILQKRHPLSMVIGGQRWILPLVGHGTNDWFVIGNLTYSTSVRRIPLFISEDSYSLVKSNLPTGSALYSQIYTESSLLERRGVRLALREGPAYTYSWGTYGAFGNRVLRYGGALVASRKGTTLEASYRKQFGLQDGIPNNGYWSILLTQKFTGSLHLE
jgi:hypothetical protein